jgi:hypothetical protein
LCTDRTFWGAFWGDDTGYDVLDGSTDFFAGWADFLTLGGSSYVRYWTGSSEFVNEDSGWYLAGGLTGTLVVAVASGGAGFGMLASRGVVGGLLAYDAVSALHGMGKSTYNAYKGTFTGWDLLSYLPIAGYGIGKFGKHVGGRSLSNTSGKVDDVVAPGSTPSNRALFEKYKASLRRNMSKPHAEDSTLATKLDELYRPGAKLGSGSTADAVRVELAFPGASVGGAKHVQKARDAVTFLERWLKNNPNARHGDIAAAENVLKDLLDALSTKPVKL